MANPCYTQIHPTCIPVSGEYQSKLTLMSESLRNDGRIWVPLRPGDTRNPRDIPESERERNLNLVSRLAPCAVILFIDLLRNGFGLSLRPADPAPADPAPTDLPPADPAPTMSVPEPLPRGALSEGDAIPNM